MCLSHSSSLRSGKSVRNWAPRDSLRSIAPSTVASAQSSMKPSSSAPSTSWLKTVPRSSIHALCASSFRRRTVSSALCRPCLVAEHGGVAVHRLAELVLDLRDAPALARARDDRVAARASSRLSWRRDVELRQRHRRRPARRRARRSGGRRSACRAASWRRAGCRRGPRRRRPRPRRRGPSIGVRPSMSVLTPPMM